jgi:rSAM/selenodomain-associated transferase 1
VKLRLVVMAKLPRAGLTKTRLIPALGADGAARLAERLLREAAREACAAAIGEVELCLAPHADDPLARELAATHGLTLAAQVAGDLGARLLDALSRGLQQADTVLLMGTDAPALNAELLREAAAALAGHDAVLVPAADGGYALIGLKQPLRTCFEQMPWSTAEVLATTGARLSAAGLSWTTTRSVHDIDTPQDLCHVPASWLEPPR